MIWTMNAISWPQTLTALTRYFPYVTSKELARAQGEPRSVTRYLAQSHELTEPEAREQLEALSDLQCLARDTADVRSHEAGMFDRN